MPFTKNCSELNTILKASELDRQAIKVLRKSSEKKLREYNSEIFEILLAASIVASTSHQKLHILVTKRAVIFYEQLTKE